MSLAVVARVRLGTVTVNAKLGYRRGKADSRPSEDSASGVSSSLRVFLLMFLGLRQRGSHACFAPAGIWDAVGKRVSIS